MPFDNSIFSNRTQPLQGSAIRAIFKMLADPSIISFAGGAPSPEVFPTEQLAKISERILSERGTFALQYGITEGYAPLREFVKARMISQGIISESEDVIITTGGQQVIDLATKCLVNEGDIVVAEAPSFVGALNTFRAYNAKLMDSPMQQDGIDVDYLEENILKKQKIKLLYVIPTFQNPTGITMSLEKRQKIADLAEKYDFFVLEDNPYGELRYSGEDIPTIKSLDKYGRVIYASSFSKILSPGMRVGFFSADDTILQKMAITKQGTDVHTPLLTQMIAHEFVTNYSIDGHIEKCNAVFREKRDVMLDAIARELPDFCKPTHPDGGLFIWCEMPEGYNAQELFMKAVEKKVAFVAGAGCMVDMSKVCPSFRLNFSAASKENIERGIKILGEVIKDAR